LNRRDTALAVFVSTFVLVGCGVGAPKSVAERTVNDPVRGVRYVVPQGWTPSDGELRSRPGSLLSLRVYDLVEAEKKFVAGLPETLIPQLLDWAKYYFIVEGPPVRTETTVAGQPAIELTYPVRVRPRDPASKVTYWVVRNGTRLFVLRAAYAPSALAEDEAAVREVVAGWEFIPPEPAN
jgi:hypothetical protein